MTSDYQPTIAMTARQLRDLLRSQLSPTLPLAERPFRPLPESDLEIDALIRANAPVWSATNAGAGL